MMEDKRKRSPNWLPSEKELLLGLIEVHYNTIENKKTDGVSIKTKLAQWQIIANSYNSQTTHQSRTADNLKAQWKSMKKQARKDAAAKRRHMIQTGGGPAMPPKKEDPILRRILALITISAVGLFNCNESDSSIPSPFNQSATATSRTEHFLEPEFVDTSTIVTITDNQNASPDKMQESVTQDWGDDYTRQLLRTPVSQALKLNNPPTDSDTSESKSDSDTRRSCLARRRPTYTATSTSLENLNRKKIEAIDFQKQLTSKEVVKADIIKDLDIEIKKEILKQEKIKTRILLLDYRFKKKERQ